MYLSFNLSLFDLVQQRPRRWVPRRHIALQFSVAGKHRFLQLERFRIKAPRFSNRLVYARHYRLGPMSAGPLMLSPAPTPTIALRPHYAFARLSSSEYFCPSSAPGSVLPAILDEVFHLKIALSNRSIPRLSHAIRSSIFLIEPSRSSTIA